jgi:hypothetical protein
LLIGAADTSDDWNYISMIIGDKNDISRIRNHIDYSKIHMRNLPKKDKDRIISKLKIKNEVFCICIQVNKWNIINDIVPRIINRKGRESKRKYVQNQYDHVLYDEIIKLCKNFLYKHKTYINDIVFEIDNDLNKFFSFKGLKSTKPSHAHEIADVIAYCNAKSRNITDIIERDISDIMITQLERRLGL